MRASMDRLSVGAVVGTFLLALAAVFVTIRHRREYRRAKLLKNLDHHEWCRWTCFRQAGSWIAKKIERCFAIHLRLQAGIGSKCRCNRCLVWPSVRPVDSAGPVLGRA